MRLMSARKAVEQLKRDDPTGKGLPECCIRRWMANGKIPVLEVSTHKRLVDYDALLKFVKNYGNQS